MLEANAQQGIKASITRYTKSFSLRIVFSQDECRYASAGLDERSQRKLRCRGTLGDGLLVWFDHQGIALKRTLNTEEPQLEGYIPTKNVKGKDINVPVMKPTYARVQEGDRPAFRLDPLPLFAADAFNPVLATPAEEAGRDILERFEEARDQGGIGRERVLEIARRLSSGDVIIGGERYANGNGHRNGIIPAAVMPEPEPPIEVEELPPDVAPKTIKDIKEWAEALNAEMAKVDNRSLMLRVVNNRIKIVRNKVVEEEVL